MLNSAFSLYINKRHVMWRNTMYGFAAVYTVCNMVQ